MNFYIKSLFIVLVLGFCASLVTGRALSGVIESGSQQRAWRALFLSTLFVFLIPFPVVLLVVIAFVAWFSVRSTSGSAAERLSIYGLLLIALPPVSVSLDGLVGINRLLDLGVGRVLCLVLLLPAAMSLLKEKNKKNTAGLRFLDLTILGYEFYSAVVFWLGYSEANALNLMRLLVEILLDTWLPYYVFSRGIKTKDDLRLLFFCLFIAMTFAAAVAVSESVLKWHLYSGLQEFYGIRWQASSYLYRGDALRVEAMAPQPILLAFTLMFGLGLWVWLAGGRWRKWFSWVLVSIFLMAIAATLSRGPMLATGVLLVSIFSFRFLSPKAYKLILLCLVISFFLMKMFGADELIMGLLSDVFGKNEDDLGTIDYRRQLLDTAIELIKQSPLLGVPDYAAHMEHLRQGEGLIDLVNSYVVIALNSGLIGLVFYLLPFVVGINALLNSMGVVRVGENNGSKLFSQVFVSLTVAALLAIFTTSTWGNMTFLLLLLKALPFIWLSLPPETASVAESDSSLEGALTPHGRQF